MYVCLLRCMCMQDETQTNLVNLRRTIYLTIMSSMDFEEAGHKLMKVGVQPGQEIELVTMIIECCSQVGAGAGGRGGRGGRGGQGRLSSTKQGEGAEAMGHEGAGRGARRRCSCVLASSAAGFSKAVGLSTVTNANKGTSGRP